MRKLLLLAVLLTSCTAEELTQEVGCYYIERVEKEGELFRTYFTVNGVEYTRVETTMPDTSVEYCDIF